MILQVVQHLISYAFFRYLIQLERLQCVGLSVSQILSALDTVFALCDEYSSTFCVESFVCPLERHLFLC